MSVNLREERIRRGLTLPQFAKAAGVNYQIARRAERGLRVREDSAKLIADFLEVDVLDVLPDETEAAA